MKKDITYAKAIIELEEIVASIENEDVNVKSMDRFGELIYTSGARNDDVIKQAIQIKAVFFCKCDKF